MNTTHETATDRGGRAGWLWVTAGLLCGLIVVQGAGMLESEAVADMTTTSQSYSMMTTDGGTDEVLVVVDSRQESLMIYRVNQSNRLQLYKREQLGPLFSRARAQGAVRP
ncbi:MAG: hypothetical protein KC996_00450 [Phycisphaerales bacterium]|nr:hypothetical protein [Phycisphaerales bacterium]